VSGWKYAVLAAVVWGLVLFVTWCLCRTAHRADGQMPQHQSVWRDAGFTLKDLPPGGIEIEIEPFFDKLPLHFVVDLYNVTGSLPDSVMNDNGVILEDWFEQVTCSVARAVLERKGKG